MSQSLVTADTLSNIPTPKSIGFSMRRSVAGPESELVTSYADYQLPPVPWGQQLAVFLEPRLASGCPDIVAVYWDVATARRWPTSRADLTSFDLRVLQYVVSAGAVNIMQVQSMFTGNIGPSVDRLCKADIIRYTGYLLHPLPLYQIFAVRRLIAIEAKVEDWRSGLSQALQNTWFASESYLLLSRLPKRSNLLREARKLGIGVVKQDQPLAYPELLAWPDHLPKSYASWLFNEWVWRRFML